MTQDEIIEMACQAFGGLVKKEERDNFVAFAKLVAEKEREACALICDARATEYDGFTEEQNASEKLAEAIRARNNQ